MEIDFKTALYSKTISCAICPFQVWQRIPSRNALLLLLLLFVCLFLSRFLFLSFFFFFYHPALQQFYCINHFPLSARKRRQLQKQPCPFVYMTSQSKSLIILLGWPGLPSFLPDTTCMKRASSKSQCAHERYVDRCPVACLVCLSGIGY